LVLALVIYDPWRARPFDLWDFPEFLPVLLGHRNILGQFAALVEHYAREGRFNILPYAVTAIKWDAFGWQSTLWQMLRFVQMMLIVTGVYLIARNFASNRVAAALAAGMFISATTATTAWIRLTMGEPLALMFFLGAVALACRFQVASNPTKAAVVISLLLLGALLSKEMIVAAFPCVILLAWCRGVDGSIQNVQLSPRNLALIGACAIVLLPACAVIAAVAVRAPQQAFSNSYGSAPLTIESYLARLRGLVIPAWPGQEPTSLRAPVNLTFLILLVFGWCVALRERDRRASTLRLLCLVGLLPALGALAYLPWPSFGAFYGLPFLIAPAILMTVAVDAIAHRLPAARYLAYGAAAFVILGPAVQAYHTARATAARDEVNFALVNQIPEFSSVDTIYVGSPVRPQDAWRLGARIARSVAVFTRRSDVPPVRDIPCSELHERQESPPGNMLLVSYANVCGSLDRPSLSLVRRFSYLDPTSVSVRSDSFRVDLLAPPRLQGSEKNLKPLWPPRFP